jgi:hypothetical protein
MGQYAVSIATQPPSGWLAMLSSPPWARAIIWAMLAKNEPLKLA